MTRSRHSLVLNVLAFDDVSPSFFSVALTFFCFLNWKRKIKFFALTFATGSGISSRNFHFFLLRPLVSCVFICSASVKMNYLFPLYAKERLCVRVKSSNCYCLCCYTHEFCWALTLFLHRLLAVPMIFVYTFSFIYLFVSFSFCFFFSCWVLSSRHEASIHPKVVPAQYTQRPRIAYVSLCASVRSQRKFYSIVSSFQSRYNMLMFMFLLYLLPSSSSFRSLVAVIVFSSPPFSLFSSLPPFVLWPHYVK